MLIQNIAESSQKFRLSFPNQQMQQLMHKINSDFQLNTAEEKDMQLMILKANATFEITYDTLKFVVKEVS